MFPPLNVRMAAYEYSSFNPDSLARALYAETSRAGLPVGGFVRTINTFYMQGGL